MTGEAECSLELSGVSDVGEKEVARNDMIVLDANELFLRSADISINCSLCDGSELIMNLKLPS